MQRIIFCWQYLQFKTLNTAMFDWKYQIHIPTIPLLGGRYSVKSLSVRHSSNLTSAYQITHIDIYGISCNITVTLSTARVSLSTAHVSLSTAGVQIYSKSNFFRQTTERVSCPYSKELSCKNSRKSLEPFLSKSDY